MRAVRYFAVFLLGFLGLSGIVGGVPLILDPTGHMLRMPLDLLRFSPFHSFLVPGILLLCANGLLALAIFGAVLVRNQHYPLLVAFQGAVLFGWLAVECWMLRLVMWAHLLYGAVALGLMVTGVVLWRAEVRRRAATRATHALV